LGLKLLVDEDSQGKLLVNQLKKAGHNIHTVNDVDLRSASDIAVFAYAINHNYVMLTHNCIDFSELAEQILQQGKHHSGLLLIYKDNNPTKDISVAAIIKALKNLQNSKLILIDQTIILNKYNY
jgi:predicted nuclease of predicted toxin-antitoxin system